MSGQLFAALSGYVCELMTSFSNVCAGMPSVYTLDCSFYVTAVQELPTVSTDQHNCMQHQTFKAAAHYM